MLISKEEAYGAKNLFKYFFVYNDNDAIRPLSIRLPQITDAVRKFEGNTTMSFKINNKKLLEKYNQIRKRVEKLLKIQFDRITAPCKCLSIIMLDSVIKVKKKYYPKTLL